ncbi:MAG: hypothetical protein ACYC96_16720 [Fimbriimonadaceae bacterium]
MAFKLIFTDEAKGQLEGLTADEKKLKRVRKCLRLLESDPRYPGLNSHKYSVIKTPDNRDLWESYVENKTPAAWRVFWCYGPEAAEITIVAITGHP